MGKNQIEPHGRFSQHLANALAAQGLSLRDLAQKIDFSYEHLRMIAMGDRPPSEPLLEKICKALKMDYQQMLPLVVRDKIERTFSAEMAALAYQISPRLSKYEEFITHLTPSQNDIVLDMIRAMVAGNRKKHS